MEFSVAVRLTQPDATGMLTGNADVDAQQVYRMYVWTSIDRKDANANLTTIRFRGDLTNTPITSSMYVESGLIEVLYTEAYAEATIRGLFAANLSGIDDPLRFEISAVAKTNDLRNMSMEARRYAASELFLETKGYLVEPIKFFPWLELVEANIETTIHLKKRQYTIQHVHVSGKARFYANGTTHEVHVQLWTRSGLNERDWKISVEWSVESKLSADELLSGVSAGTAGWKVPELIGGTTINGKVKITVATYDDPKTKTLRGVVVEASVGSPGDAEAPMPDGFAPKPGSFYGLWAHLQTDLAVTVLSVHLKLTARPPAYFMTPEVMIHDVEAIGEGTIKISLKDGRASSGDNSSSTGGMSLSGRFQKVSVVGVVTIARINKALSEANGTEDSRFPPLVLQFHGILSRQDPATGMLWRLEAGMKLLKHYPITKRIDVTAAQGKIVGTYNVPKAAAVKEKLEMCTDCTVGVGIYATLPLAPTVLPAWTERAGKRATGRRVIFWTKSVSTTAGNTAPLAERCAKTANARRKQSFATATAACGTAQSSVLTTPQRWKRTQRATGRYLLSPSWVLSLSIYL